MKGLTQADLRAFLRDVIAGKTAVDVKTKKQGRAIVKGGSGTGTRTFALSSILTYAVAEGYRPDNPGHGITLPAGNRRKVRLTPEQYKVLGTALAEAEANGECWQAVEMARLIALNACRRDEMVSLKRTACDLAGSSGESVRPLGRAAVDVLRRALKRSNGPYVFPAVRLKKGHYGGFPKAWGRIVSEGEGKKRKRRPELVGVTPHILRHAFASLSDDLGYSEATIGAMLGHSKGTGTTRGYIHKLDPALIAAADKVAGRIAEMMAGRDVATGEVVEMSEARAR